MRLGDGCKVQNSVSIYQGVTIEDDVFVGSSVSFTNDKVPRAFNLEWKIIEKHWSSRVICFNRFVPVRDTFYL